MNLLSTDVSLARELDGADELASFRGDFVIDDPNLIYLDGNSLGRLPKRSIRHIENAIVKEWGGRILQNKELGLAKLRFKILLLIIIPLFLLIQNSDTDK